MATFLQLLLTLVKGDEGVEAGEEGSDRALLRQGRNRKTLVKEFLDNQLVHHCAAFRRVDQHASHGRFAVDVPLPELEILGHDWPQAGKPRRHNPLTSVVEDESAKSELLVGVSFEGNVTRSNPLVIWKGALRSSVPLGAVGHSRNRQGRLRSQPVVVALFVLSVQLPQLTLFPSGLDPSRSTSRHSPPCPKPRNNYKFPT